MVLPPTHTPPLKCNMLLQGPSPPLGISSSAPRGRGLGGSALRRRVLGGSALRRRGLGRPMTHSAGSKTSEKKSNKEIKLHKHRQGKKETLERKRRRKEKDKETQFNKEIKLNKHNQGKEETKYIFIFHSNKFGGEIK